MIIDNELDWLIDVMMYSAANVTPLMGIMMLLIVILLELSQWVIQKWNNYLDVLIQGWLIYHIGRPIS